MELPDSEQTGTLDWPHAPPHRLAQGGVYFVTARTRDQLHLLADDTMKDWFEVKLLELADEFGWQFEAWCVLSNHYHFVAHSPARVVTTAWLKTILSFKYDESAI